MGRKLLTEAEINAIRQLRRDGYSYSKISRNLNFSKTTCCKYSQDINIERQKIYKSDCIDYFLIKLRKNLKQLLEASVSPDVVDTLLKRCKQKLEGYDNEFLYILQENHLGYLNFLNIVLGELSFPEEIRFFLKTAKPSCNSTAKEVCTDEERSDKKDDCNGTDCLDT